MRAYLVKLLNINTLNYHMSDMRLGVTRLEASMTTFLSQPAD